MGFTYNPFTYKEYTEGDAVKAAGQKRTDAEKALANYGSFAWADQGRYDNLIKQYENRPDFSYDFNGDALYQQYKDKYIQQGKMAMADTMGQAAAMTGGYGNSYAAAVGNQAYQSHLSQLNDVIPELYQMAYDRYQNEGQDMLNMIGLLGNERDFAYGQHMDGYNKLVNDRDYYGTQYNNERTFDYGKYDSDRTLAHGEHTNSEGYRYSNYRDDIADAQWQTDFDEAQRQFNEQMAWTKKQYEDEMSLLGGGSGGGGSGGGSGSGGGGNTPQPTETKITNSFIANHQTKEEYMRRGKNYNQYKAYIEAEIRKAEDSFSDEELMYLKQYYGF